MTTTTVSPAVGYQPGTWTIDAVHSTVGFVVRHMMVSKVRGRFAKVEGTIVTAADPARSSATASIDLSSVDTGNEQRDAHLRGADFFSADGETAMTYRSTGVHPQGDEWLVDGELTIAGITRSVPLVVELTGFGPDAYGGTRVGFSATGELSRKDFGITYNQAIEGGGVVISDKVSLSLEIEAVLDQTA